MLHHELTELVVVLAAIAVALVIRVAAGNPNSVRHRTRMLRWRIRLYLRPGHGYANIIELAFRWSRLRAVWTGRRARPSLPWWARMIFPVTYYAIRLGRAQLGKRVIASMEDQVLVLAPPRTGKSGWLADRIIDHPGAVVTTTTRTDLLRNTGPLRATRGTLHVFNPEGIGGYPSTFRWNPLLGCDQPAVALQRASAFTAATESRGLQDMAFWVGKASAALACLMHAAALTGRTMTDVYQWAHGIDDTVPAQILATHPRAAEGWIGPVREIHKPGRTADSIRMTITRALAWLADPAVAAATTPDPGEGFDVAEFVSAPNTLYMIGGGRDDAPIAPLFRAFAEYLHTGAAFTGSFQPSARLDPPLLLALDEVVQICPVPLPLWMADSAGKGVLIVAVCHGLAQLESRWQEAGARAIWDTAGIKVILGGVSDADTLDGLSRLCGEINVRTRSRSRGHDGHWGDTISYQPVRILPPELLRTLPDRRALVISGNLSPVVIRLRMAWRRLDYLQARLSAGTRHRSPAGRTRRLPSGRLGDLDAIPALLTDPAGNPGEWEVLAKDPWPDGDNDTGAEADPNSWAAPTDGWPTRPSRPVWLPPANGSATGSRRPWLPPTDDTDDTDETDETEDLDE